MSFKNDSKVQKKLAKAEAKAAKKSPPLADQPVPPVSDTGDKTPAQRSVEVAEKQLALHRWKVIFAAVSALIALVSLIVLLLRS
jgi:hypothetical protein